MDPVTSPALWQQFMSSPAAWLFWANVAVWIGLCAYLVFLGRTQTAIRRRIRSLEQDAAGEDHV